MFLIPVVIFGSSTGALIYDFKNRSKFNEFKKTRKTDDGFEVIEGKLTGDVVNMANLTKNAVYFESTEYGRGYEIVQQEVFKSVSPGNSFSISLPISQKNWYKHKRTVSNASNLNIHGVPILFRNTEFSGLKNSTLIEDNIKHKMKYIENGTHVQVFGKGLSDKTMQVKYLTTKGDVNRIVRDEHFGINNFTTCFITALSLGSFVCILTNFKE